MNSRMDRYENETPALKSRTERNKDLYSATLDVDYDKFDINSNISVLQNNARSIDVNQIRDMLDKKYRDNIPQRKSIDIPNFEEEYSKDELEDTKEYDLSSIISKVKEEKQINYEEERLTKNQNAKELIDKINQKYQSRDTKEEDNDLKELINTITALELKSNQKDAELLDLVDETTSIAKPKEESIISNNSEEEFYTGKLSVKEEDFEDFKDIQNDIKSNSIFIKILAFLFIIILIGAIVFVVNNIFDLGLF